ncbi:MAG: ABC-F family ATP-binding cassette domain-containing protein [Bacillota bacterium]
MAILSLTDIHKSFGGWDVLAGVTFSLNPGERAGLVGRNGAGKTTLLRLIAGLEEPDRGDIARPGRTRLGYLSQDPDLDPEGLLLDEVAKVFLPLREMEEEMRRLERQMAEATDAGAANVGDRSIRAGGAGGAGQDGGTPPLERLMEDYARLTARFETAGGYDTASRTRAILFGLGFGEDDLGRKTGQLSGGQRMRAGLAMLLLSDPDLMILDEPTNHLDIQSTEWLEEYLRAYKGALLLVSHDRYFLDRVTTKIIELDRGQTRSYLGNFTAYRMQRDAELEQQEEAYRRQQEEVARLRSYIQKYMAGNRSTMAKSRQKMLARMELIERPRGTGRVMGLDFTISHATGEEVLAARGLARAFGDKVVFDGLDLDLERGQRLALVGPNGAGKTTLLKVITGQLEPTAGSYEWGVGVELGYFSQDLSGLDDRQSVLDEILDASDMLIGEARSLLARFLFTGDDVYKLVGTLSGGERNRLAMAKLMISGANVLLLDEPTNHLDMESRAALEESLLNFPGTLIFVSHDRYFVDRLATHVLVLGEGRPRFQPGNYSAYRAGRAQEAAATTAGTAGRPSTAGRPTVEGDRQPAARPGRRERDLEKARREASKRAARLEADVARLEAEKADLERRLADPASYAEDGGRGLVASYDSVRAELERTYAEWEAALGEAEQG